MVTAKATAQHTNSMGSHVGLPSTGFCSSVTNATTTMEVKITRICTHRIHVTQEVSDAHTPAHLVRAFTEQQVS